jgi:lactoylglutathione lyase
MTKPVAAQCFSIIDDDDRCASFIVVIHVWLASLQGADTVDFMRRVDYVIQYVESLRRSVTFYRDVIGLKVRIEGDGYVEFAMANTKFSLFERSKLPELIGREGGSAPCGEIGFLIEDVDEEAERLRGLGVEILSGPIDRPWHERTLHIADPDGNIIEFVQKLR